jgi:hypothetical protein
VRLGDLSIDDGIAILGVNQHVEQVARTNLSAEGSVCLGMTMAAAVGWW